MGRPLGNDTGGIAGLLDLPREHWEAIEADLLANHYRLSDIPKRLNWRELKILIQHSPQTSALAHLVVGDAASWSTTDHLLGSLIDWTAILVWLNSDTKKNPRPKPINRPGQKSKELTFGSTEGAVPESEFWDRWYDETPLEIEEPDAT